MSWGQLSAHDMHFSYDIFLFLMIPSLQTKLNSKWLWSNYHINKFIESSMYKSWVYTHWAHMGSRTIYIASDISSGITGSILSSDILIGIWLATKINKYNTKQKGEKNTTSMSISVLWSFPQRKWLVSRISKRTNTILLCKVQMLASCQQSKWNCVMVVFKLVY